MTYLAIMSWTADNRVAKYEPFAARAEALAHVARFSARWPDAFVAEVMNDRSGDWRIDPIQRRIVVDPPPPPPTPTATEIVARRTAGDPLFAAMIRRQARVEGKTEAQMQAELVAEMV